MAKGKQAPVPRTLRGVLLRQAGKRTVLGVAIPVLGAMIDAHRTGRPFGGATATEIQTGFEALASRYLHSEFSTTYLVRPLGTRGFLDRERIGTRSDRSCWKGYPPRI